MFFTSQLHTLFQLCQKESINYQYKRRPLPELPDKITWVAFELSSKTSLLLTISFGMTFKANADRTWLPSNRVIKPCTAETGSCTGSFSCACGIKRRVRWRVKSTNMLDFVNLSARWGAGGGGRGRRKAKQAMPCTDTTAAVAYALKSQIHHCHCYHCCIRPHCDWMAMTPQDQPHTHCNSYRASTAAPQHHSITAPQHHSSSKRSSSVTHTICIVRSFHTLSGRWRGDTRGPLSSIASSPGNPALVAVAVAVTDAHCAIRITKQTVKTMKTVAILSKVN